MADASNWSASCSRWEFGHRKRDWIFEASEELFMNWTCEQTEARLSDYLDGLLQPVEQSSFNLHVNTCEKCAPLVAGVARALGGLYALEPVEAPAELENAILTATLGAPSWRNLRRWLKGLQSPRFVYNMASIPPPLATILPPSPFSFPHS